jgi:succinate dehydrogenase flavin-adding protein (antitoxin of CptAB toxin-antitoxin module)
MEKPKKMEEMEKPKKMEEMEKPKKMEEMEKPKKMEEMEKPKKMEEMEKPKKMEEMEKPKKTEKEYLPNITPKQKMTSKMVTTFYNNLEKQPKPEEIKQIKSKSPILQDFYYLYDTLLENLNTKTGAEDAMNFFKNTMISQETDIEIFPDVEKYYENIYDKFKNWNEGNPSETERGIKALDKIFNLFITTETKKSKFDKNVDKLIAQMTNYFGRAASKFGPVETHRAAYEEFINTMIMDIMQLFKENEKTEKTEKPEKLEKIEKLEKPEKSKKSEKLEETEKPKKIETPKKIEKSKKLKKLSPEKMIEEIKELLETIQYYINEDEKIPKDIYEHFYPRLEEYRIMKTEEFEPDFDTEKLKLNNEIGRALKYMDKNRL